MSTNQQSQQTQHTAALQELCFFPTLTLLVFVRRRVGLRLVKPIWLLRTFVLLQVYAVFGVALMRGSLIDTRVVQVFSFAFLLAATAHYCRAWREFNKGIRSHTYSSGISRLEGRRIPRFLRTHRRIYRILDPLFCLVIACCVLVISHPLGLWLVVASYSLSFFEQAVYKGALTRDLDTVDGLSEAEIQQQTVEFFSGTQSQGRTNRRRTVNQLGGIPTGVAPDIARQIAARQRRGDNNS